MANEVLYIGGGFDSVRTSGTVVEVNISDNSFWDNTYQIIALQGTTSAFVFADAYDSAGALTTIANTETGWLHGRYRFTNPMSSGDMIFAALDSSGFPWIAVRCNGGSNSAGLYYNSGTGASPVWTQIGSSFTYTQNSNSSNDFKVVINSGGTHSIDYYYNGTIGSAASISGTFTQASFTNIRSMKCGYPAGGNGVWWGLAMTRGINTVGAQVKMTDATGAGTTSNWAGAYTDINESKLNDTTAISETTTNDVVTYAWADTGTLPSGTDIISTMIWCRGKNDGTAVAPQNIKPVCRSGSTDYPHSSNFAGISSSYANMCLRFDNDPNTGTKFTSTTFNAAEFGLKATT